MPAMVVNDNACDLDERGATVGAGLPAMVVNDNACDLDERGALESIASRLAPTGSRDCVKNLFCGVYRR